MDFLFKVLIVWQKAMELTKMDYALIRRFTVEERYALGDQLRRAVVSYHCPPRPPFSTSNLDFYL